MFVCECVYTSRGLDADLERDVFMHSNIRMQANLDLYASSRVMSTSAPVLKNAYRGVERAKGGCGEEDGLSGRGRRGGRVATRCCIRVHL